MKTLTFISLFFIVFTSVFAQQRGIGKSAGVSSEDIGGTQHALLIGNNAYEYWQPLKTAVRDVEGLRDVLVRRYGFKQKDILLYKDASRRKMLEGFSKLRERSKEDDSVLIYYAGHGMFDEKQDGYWVPVDGEVDQDYDYVSNADVLNRLGSIEARHKLLISDSCFSGNLLTRGMSPVSPSELRKPGYYLQKNRLKSVQGFTSGGDEPVYDGGPRWGGNSVFAYHLIAQLEANQQQYLSATQIGQVVTAKVSDDTQTLTGAAQTPLIQPIRNQGDQGGEFFFKLPKRQSRSVLSLFSPPKKGVLEGRSEGAYEVIETRMSGMVRGLEGLRWQRESSGTAIDLNGLSKMMTEEKIDAVLFWTLQGKVEEEPSLLWQGMAYLDLYLMLYTLEDGRAVERDRYVLTGERLPVEELDMSDSEMRAHFRDLAEKITKHWEENGAARFVRSVLE